MPRIRLMRHQRVGPEQGREIQFWLRSCRPLLSTKSVVTGELQMWGTSTEWECAAGIRSLCDDSLLADSMRRKFNGQTSPSRCSATPPVQAVPPSGMHKSSALQLQLLASMKAMVYFVGLRSFDNTQHPFATARLLAQ